MHDDKFTKGLRGEFKGDFTRDTFDPLKHFSRVLMQQGRVQLDADKNESDSIHLYHLRTLAADLMGPHGVPAKSNGKPGSGFEITLTSDGQNFNIARGHYYVNGILCENDNKNVTYVNQPDFPLTPEESRKPLPNEAHLVYLDVWERHISSVEDEYIREKALGGVDTATRSQIVWQVKILGGERFKRIYSNLDDLSMLKNEHELFLNILRSNNEIRPGTGLLKARARKAITDNNDPCLTSPEARYRGTENQLYRVEIHNSSVDGNPPTFKWSRENASVIFPITNISGDIVTLENLGRDSRLCLKPNDWVEIVDDDYTLRNRANTLLQVEDIDAENSQVTLKSDSGISCEFDSSKHPFLRRWDQTGEKLQNAIPVSAGTDWILLEDGVEIQFPLPKAGFERDELPAEYEAKPIDFKVKPVEKEVKPVEKEVKPVELERIRAEYEKIIAEYDKASDENKKSPDEYRKIRAEYEKILAEYDKAPVEYKKERDGSEKSPAEYIKVRDNNKYEYHTGDYWLIPARTATGDVEWPGTPSSPEAMPAQGVEHHYAPLAIINTEGRVSASASKKIKKVKKNVEEMKMKNVNDNNLDLRRKLIKMWD